MIRVKLKQREIEERVGQGRNGFNIIKDDVRKCIVNKDVVRDRKGQKGKNEQLSLE